MLDLKELAARRDEFEDSLRRRNVTIDVDEVLEQRRQLADINRRLQDVRAETNQLAKSRSADEDDRARARVLRDLAKSLEQESKEAGDRLEGLASWLPNYLDPRVPAGDENQAVEVTRTDVPAVPDWVRPHDDVATELGWLDVAGATRLAGSRFYSLTGQAVLFRHALLELFLEIVADQTWTLISPPVLARRSSLYASGYLPFADKDNFAIDDSDLSLIGTSEQAILGMMQGERLESVPLRYLGDSMCFRTEAGSHGRDVRGMLRVHQFYKLEQFLFCDPADSEAEHLQCQRNIEQFVEALELPYRTIICSSQDVAAPGYFKYDLEAWFPSQGVFRELTSNTNMGDYQTRRAGIRSGSRSPAFFPHTISATGFCDRHIAAFLENNQREDGSVDVPERLRPHLGGIERLTAST